MLSPSAPTILFEHLFFNDQKYGGVIQLFSPHIRPTLPIIRSFAMTLLHQIFRQAQSSICLNSPVLLNSTLFPDRFTVLRINVTFHINVTFQKVGIVCGTLSIVLSANVCSRPFHRVTHKCNISIGRNSLRHCRLALCLAPPFTPDRFTVLRIQITFQKVGTVCGTLNIVLSANVYSRPFQRVTHKCNFSKGRSSQRRPAALEFDGICGKVFLDHKSNLEDDSVIELS